MTEKRFEARMTILGNERDGNTKITIDDYEVTGLIHGLRIAANPGELLNVEMDFLFKEGIDIPPVLADVQVVDMAHAEQMYRLLTEFSYLADVLLEAIDNTHLNRPDLVDLLARTQVEMARYRGRTVLDRYPNLEGDLE